jgi:hypothetical protein
MQYGDSHMACLLVEGWECDCTVYIAGHIVSFALHVTSLQLFLICGEGDDIMWFPRG